jgi:pilus assembly protein CpaC
MRAGVVALAVWVGVPLALSGQAPAAQAPTAPEPAAAAPGQAPTVATQETNGGRIRLIAGRSTVLTTAFDITRAQITIDTVADITPVTPRELLIDGKTAGTISLYVWGLGTRVHYELIVEPAVTTLEQRMQELFPGEDIKISVTEGSLILSGRASSNEVMLRAGEVAAASMPELQVMNLLQLPGGGGSQQVMLQVRVAEVNRRAVEEIGLSLFATRQGFTARATTQQFPAPDFDDNTDDIQGLVFADYLNLFFFQRNEGLGGVLKALQQSGNLQSLAEPNLIAYNGKEASVLVGGEIPIPVVSGASGQVSVMYKEFGVRLRFTPTIAGDVIRLQVRPEVSTLDFANGITLSGFRIPALSTRYAQTEVELRDGQSFAVAGLLNTIGQVDQAWIPILSKLPLIGNIFKSRAKRTDQTELMVIVTPRLTRPLNPDEVPPLPTTTPGLTGGGLAVESAPGTAKPQQP